jgi:hypothetical protein
MPDPVLPEAWATVLDTMNAHLQEAVAAADERVAHSLAVPPEPTLAGRRDELATLARLVQGLPERAARARAVADAVDQVLSISTDCLRRRLVEVESVRHRLAAWAGRAIG